MTRVLTFVAWIVEDHLRSGVAWRNIYTEITAVLALSLVSCVYVCDIHRSYIYSVQGWIRIFWGAPAVPDRELVMLYYKCT